MNITEKQVLTLLSAQPELNKLAFTILIHRMARRYELNSSQEVLRQCTQEINEFLNKYALAMRKDYAYIMKNYADRYTHDEDFMLLAA